ncbi:cytochrome P450 [Nonomuraea sp. NPDC000554]|uniref:cytochrome P450 n=1 Tax=Nonomuraea sp. NPDC000554 TaxID=3154259 RepID=UPI003321286D
MTAESDSWPWVDLPPGPGATRSPALARRHRDALLEPVRLPSGDEVPMLVRYDDVQAALADPASSRTFSDSDPTMVQGPSIERVPDVLINEDAPEHTRLRRIVAAPFSARQIERWRPAIAAISGELIDGLGDSFDLVEDFALPLSSRAICKVLGVPREDHDRFHTWGEAFLSTSSAGAQARGAAMGSLMEYAATLVARHRADPGEDLVDSLIHARDEQDRLTETELVNMLLMLIVAGHETLALMISRAVYRLMWSKTYAWLVDDPSLIDPAVEEVLRYDGPGNYGLLRRMTADVVVPSGVIAAGTVVLPSPYAGNHDPAAFPQPGRFDTRRYTRPDTRKHLAFGHGPHYCLGANLARMELQEALKAIVARLPALRPSIPLDEVPWTTDGMNYRPRHLPCART